MINLDKDNGSIRILKSVVMEWRSLRDGTVDHKLSCDCANCGKRRKVGAKLNMPYAGPVNENNSSFR